MTHRGLLALALLALATSPVRAAPSDAGRQAPWISAGAFSADPAAVLAAAREIEPPGGAGVDVLFQEVTLTFDGDGRVTRRRHWIYRIVTRQGLEDWSHSEARWSPGYQEKPAVRARVLSASAVSGDPPSVRWLDPDALRFSDTGGPAIARAPLPALRLGAVVEEEIVVRDLRPFSEAGSSGREVLALPVPVHHGRLVLAAPIGLPLRYGARRIALEPVREIAAGRVRLTFEYRDLPAAEPPPAGLPGDRPRFPHVAWSTGEGWPQVAATLSRQVDASVAGSDPGIVLVELGMRAGDGHGRPAAAGTAQTERIAEVLRALRSRITPVRRALEAGGIAWTPPEAVLERAEGGALDLAVLLVSALRAEGIPAYLALVRAGYDQDVEEGLPGTGLFNHALVYVPAARPLWVDPSDPFSRAGELASSRQGRRALVASPTTRELLPTPAPSSQDNRTLTEVDVFLADEGPGRFVERNEYHGLAERNQRRLAASLDAADRRRGYLDYVRSAYRAEELGEVEETFAKDLSSPYRLKLEALDAGRAFTGPEEAAVAIDLRPLLATLPQVFLARSEGPRRDDFVFHEPFVTEWRYRIVPPDRWQPRPLPGGETRPLGAAILVRSFRLDGDAVVAHFRLDSGPRRVSARQFEACREAAQELYAEETLVLWFDRIR